MKKIGNIVKIKKDQLHNDGGFQRSGNRLVRRTATTTITIKPGWTNAKNWSSADASLWRGRGWTKSTMTGSPAGKKGNGQNRLTISKYQGRRLWCQEQLVSQLMAAQVASFSHSRRSADYVFTVLTALTCTQPKYIYSPQQIWPEEQIKINLLN